MPSLDMHYLGTSDRGEIADTYDCRKHILDWIEENKHRIRRCFDGMFSTADSAPSLLQIIGVDSFHPLLERTRGSRFRNPSSSNCVFKYVLESGFAPYQVFCYDDELTIIEGLLGELEEKFPFDPAGFEREGMPRSELRASFDPNRSRCPRSAYMEHLREGVPSLRERLSSAFPDAYEQAESMVVKRSNKSIDDMDEEEIRDVAGKIIEGLVSFEDFEEGLTGIRMRDGKPDVMTRMSQTGKTRQIATIATWMSLSDEKHVVSGLRDVVNHPGMKS